MTDAKVHHQTERGAGIALAKKQISRASHEAVLRGEISLAQAKELGRDRGPHDTGQASSGRERPQESPRKDRERLCSCGGTTKGGRFLPGHNARLRSELVAQIKKGDVLLRSKGISDQQREFAVRHGLIGKEALPTETGEEKQR